MGMPRRSRIALTVLLALGYPALAAAKTWTFSWESRPVEIREGADGYSDITIERGISPTEIGAPNLPWVHASIDLAPGEVVTSWRFVPDASRVLRDGVRPRAVQIEANSRNPEPPFVEIDPSYLQSAYPAERAVFQGMRSTRGNVSAGFLFTPFRWDGSTGRLEFIPGGTLEVEVGPASPGMYLPPPLRQPDSLDQSSARRGGPDGTVLEANSGGLRVSALPSLEGDAVECVIVTTQSLASSFSWLMDWKNRNGHPTVTRTVEEIYAAYPQGVDQADKIRLFLRDAYLYWGLESVVVGGDPELVPIRTAVSYAYLNGATEITTDLYYACLDGNWNANGNSIFGESASPTRVGDQTDFNPELRVGRISARSASEVAIYRTKYQDYVMNPPEDPYFENVLTLGEVLFPSNWRLGDCDDCNLCDEPCVSTDGASDCFDVIDEMSANPITDWSFNELYERDYWWKPRGHPDAEALNLNSVVSSINSGQNIIFHAGHGDRDRWAIGPDRMETRNLRALTNGPRWGGVVYAVNCNSAAVAYDCAAEGWCFSPNGGGLAYVGSTNLDFPNTASVFRRQTFELWPGDGFTTMGHAVTATADSIASGYLRGDGDSGYRFLLYSLIYLGDPDMHIWWKTPRALQAVYPAEVALGSDETLVAVTLAGSPVAGARVTLYKDGDAYAVGETAASGQVSLPFQPTETGQFLVTVTHPQGKPFQGTGTVTSASAAFLSISGFAVDDAADEEAGIEGNGNGVIEIGETVSLDLSLSNNGTAAATDAVASLAVTEDAGLEVTVLDGEATLGTIGAGGTAEATRAFQIRVLEGATVDLSRLRETLQLAVTLGPPGLQHTETIAPNAHRALLDLFSTTSVELDDAPDGIPQAGETWKVAVELMNEREATASGLRVRLAPALGNGILVEPDTLLLPDAEQFEVVASDTFTVDFLIANQTALELSLEDTRTDPPTQIWKRGFDLTTPSTPSQLMARGLRSNIVLTWTRPADPDLAGYRIFRSDDADGPYERLGGTVPVASSAAANGYYSDEGLPPLTAYFYRIAAVDSSGNVSALSDSFPMSTSPGFATGWPVTLEAFSSAPPLVEDLNGWGDFEVITASDVVYAFNSDGTDYFDGDENGTTSGKLTSPEVGDDFRGKCAVADVDGDGIVEVIATPNFRRRANGEPRNVDLVVFDNLGRVKWRKPLSTTIQLSSPAVGNLEDTGSDLEIVVIASRSVFAFHGDGTPVGQSADGRLLELPTSEASFLYGSVALADVAGGPGAEIIFTTRGPEATTNTKLHVLYADGTEVPGFPYEYSQSGSSQDGSNSSPAVADIVTDDPKGEVVITTKQRIYMIDPTNAGNPVVWWRELGFFYDLDRPNPSPALGDINRDGMLEIVIGGDRGQLFVLDALTGEPLPAFDPNGDGNLKIASTSTKVGSAIIGDLTGDQYPEILVGDSGGRVYCFGRDGVQLPGFPYVAGGDITAGLAMWDIDKDHHVNVVIQGNSVQSLVVLDFPQSVFDHGNPDLGRYPWTQFRHDSRNSGWMQTSPLLPLALQAPELTATRGLEVELRWVGQPGFSKFHLYRRPAAFEEFTLVGDWSPEDVANGSESEFRAIDRVPEPGTYVYRLVGVERDGYEVITADREITVSAGTLAFALHAPHPNPFDQASTIRLDLPRTGPVSVRILDPTGRRVRTLMDGVASAGSYTRTWDGKDENGHECVGGVYFVSVVANGVGEKSAKLIRLR